MAHVYTGEPFKEARIQIAFLQPDHYMDGPLVEFYVGVVSSPFAILLPACDYNLSLSFHTTYIVFYDLMTRHKVLDMPF